MFERARLRCRFVGAIVREGSDEPGAERERQEDRENGFAAEASPLTAWLLWLEKHDCVVVVFSREVPIFGRWIALRHEPDFVSAFFSSSLFRFSSAFFRFTSAFCSALTSFLNSR